MKRKVMSKFFEGDEEVKVVVEEEPKKVKGKTLFDHVRQITQYKNPDYFKTLSDLDKKSWSTFMILRFLSMNDEWVEIVNEIQPITTGIQLKPELVYQLLIRLIPQSSIFLKYIKNQTEEKYTDELISIFVEYYGISKKEALDYLRILYRTIDGVEEARKIVAMYGHTEKEVKRITKLKETKTKEV
jgi:hypothetical protein